MLEAVLFDLDDTLYDEADFFRSGFGVVSECLEQRGFGRRQENLDVMLHLHLREGRERVLQKMAARLGFPEEWIPDLVVAFRSHVPRIVLPPDVRTVLPRLRAKYRLGCVTDGWADVQRRKIESLGVGPLLDAIVIADDAGRQYWKPHALPFLTCCESLGTSPAKSVFVGDNPSRDMAGAANAGMQCVRMRRPGSYFEHSQVDGFGGSLQGEVADLYALERLLESCQDFGSRHAE